MLFTIDTKSYSMLSEVLKMEVLGSCRFADVFDVLSGVECHLHSVELSFSLQTGLIL